MADCMKATGLSVDQAARKYRVRIVKKKPNLLLMLPRKEAYFAQFKETHHLLWRTTEETYVCGHETLEGALGRQNETFKAVYQRQLEIGGKD